MALSKKQLAERKAQLQELGDNYCRQIAELISGCHDETQLLASEKQVDQIGSVIRGGIKAFIWRTVDPEPESYVQQVVVIMAEDLATARTIAQSTGRHRGIDSDLEKWSLKQVTEDEPDRQMTANEMFAYACEG